MSNLWDIARTVGSKVISNFVPGGSAIIDVVNTLLPASDKLSTNATGDDITNAINGLPEDQRGALMAKKFDVDITKLQESYSTVRTMLESDAANPQSTRPYIAKHSFHVMAFTIITAISIWAYGIIEGKADLVKAVVDGWPFILAATAPLATLLYAYFGVLKQEHKNRLDAAGGSTKPSGLVGLIQSVMGK